MNPPSDKVAVVTGGARGLGRAISLRLARDNIAVSVWDLDEAGAVATADLIKAEGGTAIALRADASATDDIAACLAQTRDELGPVNILVNNAALSPFSRFLDISESDWDRLLNINLKGPFLCCQAIIPDMLDAGWGRIVNIASSAAQTGSGAMAHYGASKGGVLGLTKCLAIEYARSGITVNAVPPGFVDTEGLREAPVDVPGFAATTPMGRPGQPENIAAAVAFLVSDEADYITGHTLGVNGGRYCN